MNAASVAKLFERVSYFSSIVATLGGKGYAWSFTFPDGETHRYVLKGLKSPQQMETDVLTLAVWLWSLKDYLKSRAETLGKSGDYVESYASNDPFLPLCADLANDAKHGKLTKSRSGKWPRLGNLSYTVPQQALAHLKFGLLNVETDVARPDLVTVQLPMLDSSGKTIGDALEVLDGALTAWERLSSELGDTPPRWITPVNMQAFVTKTPPE